MTKAKAVLLSVLLVITAAGTRAQQTKPDASSREAALLGAVFRHDAVAVKALLEEGVPPDAKDKDNNRTALFFAAENGDLAIVRLLLQHGADVTTKDTPHGEVPVGAAARRGHADVVRLLLARDASFAQVVAWNAVYQNAVDVLEAALGTGRLTDENLSFLLDEADRNGSTDVADRLKRAGVLLPKSGVAVAEPVLATYVGDYRTRDGLKRMTISLKDGVLYASQGDQPFQLAAFNATYFVRESQRFPTLNFSVQAGRVVELTHRDADGWTSYTKIEGRQP